MSQGEAVSYTANDSGGQWQIKLLKDGCTPPCSTGLFLQGLTFTVQLRVVNFTPGRS